MLKESFLSIEYQNNMDGCSNKQPKLTDWYIVENGFTNTEMKIKLIFENPVYVSSGTEPCIILIKVLN